MSDHVLRGCRPMPLASYLKGLGVLRLVGEQADPGARGSWDGDTFRLRTTLDRSRLERFFLHDYRPTPIIAPWNGGSGFYPKDNRDALDAIVRSPVPRLAMYRAAIEGAGKLLAELGIREKVAQEDKQALLEACRARLPDEALAWLDAAYLIAGGNAKYPPLLGTGGNDGRLDFTNNFMQRLLDVIDPSTGAPSPGARELLAAALFDEPTELLTGGAIGQFMPAAAGGANASAGFAGDPRFNAWDFVLMLEGAATFAVAAVRRFAHESDNALAYPFSARSAGVGYASACSADEPASRGEIWMPLWGRPATAREVRSLLAEGRVRVAGRTARNGVDFARATATLGIDRGFSAMQRYGFQVRNGLAYLATPLGRFDVRSEPRARLVDSIDGWLTRFRRHGTAEHAPASVQRALRGLEEAIVELCRHADAAGTQSALVWLGRCERALARSFRWALEKNVQPVPPLALDWLRDADDGSVELRLAAALASVHGDFGDGVVPLRCHFEPVTTHVGKEETRTGWNEHAGRDVAWREDELPVALNAVFARRLVRCVTSGVNAYPDRGRRVATLGDVAAFVEGRTVDERLVDLLWGCLLLDWRRTGDGSELKPPRGAVGAPGATYALMKLCFPGPERGVDPIPAVPRIHRLAAAGRGAEATREAARRLHASGFAPAVSVVSQESEAVRRAAAALAFPLANDGLSALRRAVLR